jgi:hypothetical protein
MGLVTRKNAPFDRTLPGRRFDLVGSNLPANPEGHRKRRCAFT